MLCADEVLIHVKLMVNEFHEQIFLGKHSITLRYLFTLELQKDNIRIELNNRRTF